MNSVFRKTTSPLLRASIFRKGSGGGGMNSLFKKAQQKAQPIGSKILGGVRKASDFANKIVSNPVLEGLAKSQGYGDTFNLAKKSVGTVNRVQDVGRKVQGQVQGISKAIKDKEDFGNVLEKVKDVKANIDEVRQLRFS